MGNCLLWSTALLIVAGCGGATADTLAMAKRDGEAPLNDTGRGPAAESGPTSDPGELVDSSAGNDADEFADVAGPQDARGALAESGADAHLPDAAASDVLTVSDAHPTVENWCPVTPPCISWNSAGCDLRAYPDPTPCYQAATESAPELRWCCANEALRCATDGMCFKTTFRGAEDGGTVVPGQDAEAGKWPTASGDHDAARDVASEPLPCLDLCLPPVRDASVPRDASTDCTPPAWTEPYCTVDAQFPVCEMPDGTTWRSFGSNGAYHFVVDLSGSRNAICVLGSDGGIVSRVSYGTNG